MKMARQCSLIGLLLIIIPIGGQEIDRSRENGRVVVTLDLEVADALIFRP